VLQTESAGAPKLRLQHGVAARREELHLAVVAPDIRRHVRTAVNIDDERQPRGTDFAGMVNSAGIDSPSHAR